MTEKPAAPPAVADPTPETARALLYRHGLPEDVIDGALCLHAQELAAVQRREADDLHQTEPGVVKGLRIGADLIDPTTPDDPAVLPAVPVPPTTHATDRATVLREAADLITERQALLETEERADIGDLDLETIQQGTAVRRMASYLRSVADTAQPSEAEAAATHARGCLDRPAVIRWCADRVRSTDGDYVVQAAAEYLDDLATEAEEQAAAGEQRCG